MQISMWIDELLNVCRGQPIIVYIASIAVLVYYAIIIYQYFVAENMRAKRLRKMIRVVGDMLKAKRAAWLVDDSRDGEPPEDE